jgi:Fe-S cluster assembly protein SufB
MKYPCAILNGDNSYCRCISVAVSENKMHQDTGAKMIHIGKNTRSQIISKSIALNGGNSTYRGMVNITESALNSQSEVICDSLILDNFSTCDTIPTEIISNGSSSLKHEAKITDFDKEKIFYINTKGIDEKQAKQLLALGFVNPFIKELPLEYAVEFNRLIKSLL